MKNNDEFQRDDLYDNHLKSDEFSSLNEIEEYDERFFHADEYNRDCYIGLGKRETDEMSDEEEAAVIRNKPVSLLTKTFGAVKSGAMALIIAAMLLTTPSISGKLDLFNKQEDAPVSDDLPVVSVDHEHSAGEWETVLEPTCEADGEEQLLCKECNEIIEKRAVQKKEHISGDWIHKVTATCISNGFDEKYCTSCGVILETRETERGTHRESGWIVDINSTCTSQGRRHTECTVCHEIIRNGTLPSGHKPVTDPAVQATCSKPGLTEGISTEPVSTSRPSESTV